MEHAKRHSDNHLMLERLITIHSKIQTGCYPNTHQLAYDLNISAATISRDIEFLRDRFNAPIDYDAKERGYFYTAPYDIPLNLVDASDMVAPTAAKTLLAHYAGTPLYDDISRIIEMLTTTKDGSNAGFLGRIAVPPLPRLTVHKPTWDMLAKALQQNLVVTFDYNGRWNPQTTHRRVRPYQLLLDEGVCYLFGYAEERQAERLFSLNRTKNLRLTQEQFALPADYDFTSRCGGGKFGSFKSEESETYVIEFYGDARSYVKDCIWADDQQLSDDDEADTTVIRFSSTQSLKIREWVLSQGANAKPLAPLKTALHSSSASRVAQKLVRLCRKTAEHRR